MRCEKCGYISFDHLDTCRKCHKPMADPGFKGTTCSVAVPVFLQLSEEMDVVDMEDDMVEVLDPDLDLLTEEAGEEISFETEVTEDQGVAFQEVPQSVASSEDDREIAFDDFDLAFESEAKESELTVGDDLLLDTSRFEDAPVNSQIREEEPPLKLQIPDDLADISDLARPDLEDIVLADAAMATNNDLDIDLDFGDLDLAAFDSPVAERKTAVTASDTGQNDLTDLSLDDLDFSAELTEISPPTSAPPVADDLDFDLDFDLDLGTLDAKQEPKKKTS